MEIRFQVLLKFFSTHFYIAPFQLDSETHEPIAVQEKKPLDTHWMVEEFMLLANISVAEKIRADFPDCAVLRRHPVRF